MGEIIRGGEESRACGSEGNERGEAERLMEGEERAWLFNSDAG